MTGVLPGVRVGVDLVRVSVIREAIARQGRRYLDRLFTPAEQAYALASAAEQARRLAARYAAKEAVIKLLRPGADSPGLNWLDIEVVRDPAGACALHLRGQPRQLLQACGIEALDLSLSHEDDYAVAVVAGLAKPGMHPLEN